MTIALLLVGGVVGYVGLACLVGHGLRSWSARFPTEEELSRAMTAAAKPAPCPSRVAEQAPVGSGLIYAAAPHIRESAGAISSAVRMGVPLAYTR